jgi:glycerate kinase
MRILVAPQEFKGSLTAAEAAACMAAAAAEAAPDARIDLAPMSDGGPGLVDVMLKSAGGERMTTRVRDPLMRPVDASWAMLGNGTAVIEMAAASGLVLLTQAERRPLDASTYGSGELIRAALDAGCKAIILGIGGSATTDAGAGAMQALGARLFDDAGVDLPPGGGALSRLARIDLSGVDPRVRRVRLRIASDVTNALCGDNGAAAMFGPQKGASADDVAVLERALRRFAEVVQRDFGIDLQAMPGSGAAGGLGAGLVVAARATIEPGFPIVAEVVRLEERIAAADLVITGEGRLDAQTAYGKTAARVAAIARARATPVIAIAGSVARDADLSLFDAVVSATPEGMGVEEGMVRTREFVASATSRAVREWRDSGGR